MAYNFFRRRSRFLNRRTGGTDRALYLEFLELNEEDLTTADSLFQYISSTEEHAVEDIVMANQILEDRRIDIRRDYRADHAGGIFERWDAALEREDDLHAEVFAEVDCLAKKVWNYGYTKTKFAVDDSRLNPSLSRFFSERARTAGIPGCVTYSDGGDLGFAWHVGRTSKEIRNFSSLIKDLCPPFLPPGMERRNFEDLPLLVKEREFEGLCLELTNKGLLQHARSAIVPENYEGNQSFVVATFCRYRDLLDLQFAGVPEIDNLRQQFLDYYGSLLGLEIRLLKQSTWSSEGALPAEIPINPVYTDVVEVPLTELPVQAPIQDPVQAPNPNAELESDSNDSENMFDESD